MDLIRKGQRSEEICEKLFCNHGYITWKSIRVKFQNIDLFGRFDILAKKKNETHYIQVKTNKIPNPNELRNEMLEFLKEYCAPSDFVEIWVRKQGVGAKPARWQITVVHSGRIGYHEFEEHELEKKSVWEVLYG